MNDGVVQSRTRTMSARAVGGEEDLTRDFLGGGDTHEADLPVGLRLNDPTFVECELAIDLIPVATHHEVDAFVRRALFCRLRQEDNVAVERCFASMQLAENFEAHCGHAFVVERAASVEVSVLHHSLERIECPFAALNAHDVGVSHEQQGLFLPATLDPSDEVAAIGSEGEDLGSEPILLKDCFEELSGARFVAGRITGVEADQSLERFHQTIMNLGGVHR